MMAILTSVRWHLIVLICISLIISEKWSVSHHINKQGCYSYQQFRPSKCEFLSPEGAQEEWGLWFGSKLQPLPTVSTEEPGDTKKTRMLAPESWDAYERNDFSKPRLLHLPIHRKVLKSLTWDIWFSSIFCCSTYLPLVANIYITWLLPTTSSEQFSQGHLRCCLPGLKS